jgi:hypothetical protein
MIAVAESAHGIGHQGRVARAEVDGAARDCGDAAAGADAAVLQRVAVRRAERVDPLRDERGDERAARAGDDGVLPLPGRRARGGQCGGERRHEEDALLRHVPFSPRSWSR